jgi:peptide/nickel transport system substrate-binding protein
MNILRNALVAAAALPLLAACGSGSSGGTANTSSSSSPVYGGTITFATSAEPTCLDPSYEGDDSQDLVGGEYLDRLVSVYKNGSYGPWLATSWTVSGDGLTYTFQLKQGVTFTDGTAFDAAAVQADINHWIAPATQSGNIGAALTGVLKSVSIPSPYTIVLHLSTPDSWLLMDLANPAAGIQSPKALARGDTANCQSPVGTGPFKVERWAHGSEIIFVRNDDYDSPPPQATHTGKAYAAEVIWKFIPEGATRFAALQDGEVGVVDGIPPENMSTAKSTSAFDVIDDDMPGVPQQLDLNTTKAPFNNIDVRKAFLYAADVKDALKSAFFGAYATPAGVLSPTTPDYDSSVANVYTFDLAKANQLLDQAGWTAKNSQGYRTKDGQELTAVLPVYSTSQTGVDTETEALYEQLQATEKEAGINLEIEPGDTTTVDQDETTYNYNLYVDYWTVNTPYALNYVYDSIGAKATPGDYHNDVSGIQDPRIDQLLQDGLDTTNTALQEKYYAEVQQVITADAVSLQLYIYPVQLAENSSKVRGLRLDWSEPIPVLYDAWVPGA